MRRRLRRFVAVGVVITGLHLGLFVVFGSALGWPIPVAAASAVAIATIASFTGHRLFTFAEDQFALVDHRPGAFAGGAIPAACVDVGIVSLLTLGWSDPSPWSLLLVEIPALLAGALVRLVLFRRVLFSAVRSVQGQPFDRPPIDTDTRVSIVVPVYKDADNIGNNVTRVRAELEPLLGPIEIVVVDDGSGDETPDAARRGGADVVLVQPANRGKGAAVRRGMLAARGAAVVFTDADLAYPPDQVARLVHEIESGWDVVVGNRRHPDTESRRGPTRLRELGSVVFNLITHLVLLGHYRDTQCGLKGFRRDVARLVFERTTVDGFAFDVEVLHLVERDGLSLREVPVVLEDHDVSTISVLPVALRMTREVLRVRRRGSHGHYDLPEPVERVLARTS